MIPNQIHIWFSKQCRAHSFFNSNRTKDFSCASRSDTEPSMRTIPYERCAA